MLKGTIGRIGRIGLLGVSLLFCAALSVCAADLIPAHLPADVASPAPAALSGFLRDSLFPVLSALCMGFLIPLINSIGAKWKIEALTQKGNYLERLAYQGITLAEERAAQLVGSKLELTGNQKLDIAVSHVLSIMPKISEAQANDMVHAVLAQIPGVGASGATALATPGAATAPAINFLPGESVLMEQSPTA
jgi:hypothetical protein